MTLNSNIIYDQPGRMRLRLGNAAFEKEQERGIEEALLAYPEIVSVRATAVNGGLLICYEEGKRSLTLKVIQELKIREIPSIVYEAGTTDDIEARFGHDLTMTICKHYLIKWFVPQPIRVLMTFAGVVRYIKKGLKALRGGRINVDVLDAVSVTAATLQKSYSTAASIMFLLGISELLEEYTRKKTQLELSESLAICVDRVWRVRDDRDQSVPMAEVELGDEIRIRTGSVIPLDGEITDGEALVNESSMTGEPLAVLKKAGSSVYAGTVLEEGALIVKVRSLADDTRIQKIVAMVGDSEERKAGVQSRAEKLADSIVPFSFLGALAVGIFTRDITKVVSVLMVDYSCAIKLSTPISIISAMREAADHQVVVKGGKYLESYARADTFVFDKTGTLTEACPNVKHVIPFADYTREQVLKLSACLEEHFPHSVARAIVKQAEREQLEHREEHADVEYVVAHGISSRLRGERVLIGSAHFIFDDEGISCTEEERAKIDVESAGFSTVYLAIGDKLAGMICIEDPVREEAAGVIAALKNMGINQIIMLTGDSEAAAKDACEKLKIDRYYSQVLPEQKASIIEELKKEGRTVIMVGDGINDSPALASSHVSVAMKGGSDIAREVADITLMDEDLAGLLTLMRLSRRLFKKISTNYGFIISFNTVLLALGIGGTIQPSTSALLHNLSTMAVSGLSMRPCLTHGQVGFGQKVLNQNHSR